MWHFFHLNQSQSPRVAEVEREVIWSSLTDQAGQPRDQDHVQMGLRMFKIHFYWFSYYRLNTIVHLTLILSYQDLSFLRVNFLAENIFLMEKRFAKHKKQIVALDADVAHDYIALPSPSLGIISSFICQTFSHRRSPLPLFHCCTAMD